MQTRSPDAEILVVYNPEAGTANEARLRQVISKYFSGKRVDYCACRPDEDMTAPLAPWLDGGVRLVIASGGDGTISDIATALVGRDAVLGILPQGTSNVLARELNLPLKIDAAAKLLAGDHDVRKLDVIRTAGTVCLLGISVGISAWAMSQTGRTQKKLFGPWAYWLPFFKRFFSMRGQEFEIETESGIKLITASDLLAMNVGTIGFRALRWGPEVLPDDGQLNLCYLNARNGFDYLWAVLNFAIRRYLRNERVNCVPIGRRLKIVSPAGLALQGDGDVIGQTPSEIILEPAVLKVAVAQNKK